EDDFVEVYKTAGQKEIANIYLNTNKISAPLMTNLNSEANGLSNIIKQFGTWVEFDFEQKNDLINLSGYTYVNDSVASLAGLINSQDLTTNTIETILPTNTVFYLRMAFTDANSFVEKMEDYNTSLGFGEKIKSELNQFNQKYNTDLRSIIYPLIDSEIGRASLVKQEDCNQYEDFLIIKTKSQTNAETEIKNICENIARAKGKTLSDFIKVFKIDEGKSFNIYTLNSSDWGALLFGPVFAGVETSYLCFYDNYMILGDSFQTLSNFIKMQVLNKVLSTDIKHSNFMSNFSKKSNLFVYFDLSRSKALLSSLLSSSAKENFEVAFKEISKIRDFAFQFSANEGLIFNYAIIKYDPEQREEPQTVWASNLYANIYSKPVIVVNHDTKAKEIIVQDEDNILHLLSESGRELWKIPIDGKILGDIQQVDALKNGKLQYFFTTETHLHLIDRLGNYLDRYPIPLRENTKVAASVFDYDNDKNYRIIVPCEDRNVYLYDIEGKIVKGWSFAKTDNQVLQPISFYRSAGSDYIFFNDKFKVYVVNRRGESRVELNTNFEFSKNNSVIFDAANNRKPDRLIASSSSGTVYFMEMSGNIDSLNIAEYSENHFFEAYDIDNNGFKELIFVDNGVLDVYKQDKSKLFSINFETKITNAPNFYRFSGNQVKIGLVSKNKETIYLLNSDGTMFEG
ncbi:MAG: hypothetical protein GX879_04185, partial [Bacteroidales bacterium]|nr:hypothetical protein [Bacteroidales bacterium]